MYSVVKTEWPREEVCKLTLNDAENRNCFSEDLCSQLESVIGELANDANLRVVVLCGLPDVFCSGASLQSLRDRAEGNSAKREERLAWIILNFPLPIVAALEGHAVGGGLILALCCDIVIAARESRYGTNFTELGFTPGMGATSLLVEAGHGIAIEMLCTGKMYKGYELKDRGLFNYVLDSDKVYSSALDLAAAIAEKPRDVLSMTKQSVALSRRIRWEKAQFQESLMHRLSFGNSDVMRRLNDKYVRGDVENSK
jgi:polyketide biosynthesis enoyl-CoA hydratase PksI